jgi:hypothetical protein
VDCYQRKGRFIVLFIGFSQSVEWLKPKSKPGEPGWLVWANLSPAVNGWASGKMNFQKGF